MSVPAEEGSSWTVAGGVGLVGLPGFLGRGGNQCRTSSSLLFSLLGGGLVQSLDLLEDGVVEVPVTAGHGDGLVDGLGTPLYLLQGGVLPGFHDFGQFSWKIEL